MRGDANGINGRIYSHCKRCGERLLLNPENEFCIMCENDDLREKLAATELMLAQCRREKQALYAKLSNERAQNVGKA